MKKFYSGYLYKIIKITVILLLILVLYKQITHKSIHTEELFDTIELSDISWWKIYIAILLVLVNWGLECTKWWYIVRKIDPKVTLGASIKSVIIGILLSMATPFRLGEYGGRVLAAHKEHSVSLLSAHFLASFLQLIVLSVFGMVSLIILYNHFNITTNEFYPDYLIYCGCILFLLISLLLMFRSKIGSLADKITEKFHLHKIVSRLSVYQLYNRFELINILLLTITRVGIFYLQYWLIISAFDFTVGWEGIGIIAIIYTLQSVIVFPALVNWFFRGELALIFWRYLDINDFVILISTYGLWVINLLIPSIIGLFMIGSFDIFHWLKKNKK